MLRQNRSPGANIRGLCFRRRLAAAYSFATACFLGVLPFAYRNLAYRFMAIATLSEGSSSTSAVSIPFLREVFILLWGCAIAFVIRGVWLWKRSNHARQGATAEEAIAQLLNPLRSEGWQFEYGVPLANRQGDVDILALSPRGNVFAIDVKSHKGTVIFQDNQLRRAYGSQSYAFEKDFLSSVMKQALSIREQRNLRFVTPVLAFSEARINIPSPKLRGVYVVDRASLLLFLRGIG